MIFFLKSALSVELLSGLSFNTLIPLQIQQRISARGNVLSPEDEIADSVFIQVIGTSAFSQLLHYAFVPH